MSTHASDWLGFRKFRERNYFRVHDELDIKPRIRFGEATNEMWFAKKVLEFEGRRRVRCG